MKIKAIAPWFGSKRTLAPAVVEQLGGHRAYWEPFCGSCAVLFAKPQATYESVNDLHQDLVNLALVLQAEDTALDLYAKVTRTLFHEHLLPVAKAALAAPMPEFPNVNRAYWYLVFSWVGLNGISGTPLNHTGTFAVRYSSAGGNGATRWASVAESVPAWHRRLAGVQILSRDAFDLLARIDDEPGTAVYCDPPYIAKGAKYVHDFTSVDHARLAALLSRFRHARVVVSYYAHPRLSELYPYPQWTVIGPDRLNVAKSMVNGGRRDAGGRVSAPEILLVNGPEFVAGGELGDLFHDLEE